MAKEALGVWEPFEPEKLIDILKGFSGEYWIAGGYAIEFFVAKKFRSHGDIDILLMREHQMELQEYLSDWELYRAGNPGLIRWDTGEYLNIPIQDIWVRENAHAPWRFQIMLFDQEEGSWVYKRDHRIKKDLGEMTRLLPQGIPYLLPEVQLLYKSKDIRPKDQLDFDHCIGVMDEKSRNWLKDQLLFLYGENHPWLALLAQVN